MGKKNKTLIEVFNVNEKNLKKIEEIGIKAMDTCDRKYDAIERVIKDSKGLLENERLLLLYLVGESFGKLKSKPVYKKGFGG